MLPPISIDSTLDLITRSPSNPLTCNSQAPCAEMYSSRMSLYTTLPSTVASRMLVLSSENLRSNLYCHTPGSSTSMDKRRDRFSPSYPIRRSDLLGAVSAQLSILSIESHSFTGFSSCSVPVLPSPGCNGRPSCPRRRIHTAFSALRRRDPLRR